MGDFDPAWHDQPRSERRPLLGKTVLVTRARVQAEEITIRLEALGASVIHFPTIEFTPPDRWSPLDDSIGRLSEYDWIVFTSANGVFFFFKRLSELRQERAAQLLAAHVLCAIGPATARALKAAGADANVVASDSRSEGALTAIVDHAGGEANVKGLRFLIPRARAAREVLPEGLRKLGATVDAVEAYQTIKPDVDPEAVIRLFKENAIDAVTFTSSSTCANFAELAGLSDLSDLLATTLVACIGPTTAETAARHGLTTVVQPELHSAAALVEVVVEAIGSK
jgi:uroporphyrinogen III methyltransferase/synthase